MADWARSLRRRADETLRGSRCRRGTSRYFHQGDERERKARPREGTKYSRPSLGSRRIRRRRSNAVAKQARKVNRG